MVNSVKQLFNAIGRKPKEESSSENEVTSSYGLGYRHIHVFLMFLTLALNFIACGHSGVTIVAMSIPENTTDETVNTRLNWKFERSETQDIVRYLDIYQIYDWPKSIHEIILGSFFVGTAVMMFPIGLLGQRFGGKVLLQITLILNAVASIVAPWFIAWGGWISFAVIRLLQGGAIAGLYPGIHFLITHWFPISERNSLSSYIYAGTGIGSMLGFFLAGVLADSELGYPGMFWLAGILCSIAFFLLTFLGSTTPSEHKFVSEKEKNYIVHDHVQEVVTKPKIPWIKIFTSIPLWATVLAHVGNSVAFNFFFTQVPSYMVGVLNFDILASGILTALPYLGSCISALAFGNLSDCLTNRKVISMKMARIIFNSIACVLPAICLLIVTFTDNSILAVVCFVIFSTANSGHHFGWMANYMDLSPNYCGTLMALGNTLANIFTIVLPIITSVIVTDIIVLIQIMSAWNCAKNSGSISPLNRYADSLGKKMLQPSCHQWRHRLVNSIVVFLLVSKMTPRAESSWGFWIGGRVNKALAMFLVLQTNRYQWRILLLLIAACTFVSNFIFIIFMSTDIQPWNKGDEEEEENVTKKA